MKVSKAFCIYVSIFMISATASAQKTTQHMQQSWFGYMNQTRFSDHWGMWADLHLRTKEDFVQDLSTAIVRLGLTYFANDQLKFTAGYAYVNHFPSDNHTDISQPEHRPWQQVQWHTNGKKTRIMQWVRLEERYRRKIKSDDELGEGYNFNFRVRYNFMIRIPLGQVPFAPHTMTFALNDEVHVNMGKEIVYNYFDQNRLFAGFSYHINKHDYIQAGYMNLFQQLASGNRYRNLHVARLNYFHNLDLRKNKK